jgi:F0F1-type ATP synthase alpha subunit
MRVVLWGNFLRDNGQHALIIYDDLSKQAVAYRQMSLLFEETSGARSISWRCILFTFSFVKSVLQKCQMLRVKGSLTALPVVETQAGDVSALYPN